VKRLILVLAGIGMAVLLIGGAALAGTLEGTGADGTTSANAPASRDFVNCGTDVVVAASLDTLDNATCKDVKTLSSGNTLREDARMYAADYGVTIEEALRRLELQEDVGELRASLVSNEAATFGDLEILHEPSFRVVAYFTQGGEQTIQPYVQGTPLEGIVETRQVGATLAELEAAQAEAISYYEAQGVRFDAGIDVTQNRAEIYLTDETRAQLRSKKKRTQNAQQLPAHVVEVTVDALAAPADDFYAGRAMNTCTSGYTVRARNGNEGFVTAAHCSDRQKFNGTVMPFQKQNMRDTHDVQWHTSPKPYDDKAWFLDRDDRGSSIREVHQVRDREHQQVGEYVCKAGMTSGSTCGRIVNRYYRPSYIRSADATFIRVERDGRRPMMQPGDSGGPVFRGNTALGIALAFSDSSDMIYMPINYVADSDLGIRRVQTTR
jgi:hypothetical protein